MRSGDSYGHDQVQDINIMSPTTSILKGQTINRYSYELYTHH